jgi:hypothetical protein
MEVVLRWAGFDPEETFPQAVSCKHSVSQQISCWSPAGISDRNPSAAVDRGRADQKIREDMVSPSPTSSFVYLECPSSSRLGR